MKRILFFLLIACMLLPLGHWSNTAAQGAPPHQESNGFPIANGYFFTATASPGYGYSVTDDSTTKFWSEFNRYGGLQNVGYPISQRFWYKGFVTQAFQKLVLQWRPEVNQAWPLNTFDELNYQGLDPQLYAYRQTPYHFGAPEPAGTPWPDVIASRWALLDANPAIRARYFSLADPLTAYGLPTSEVEDMGNHYAIRTQRAVFQQWKEAVPWAAAGQVTIANGGDIAKEMGAFPAEPLQPEPDYSVQGPIPHELIIVTVQSVDPMGHYILLTEPYGRTTVVFTNPDTTISFADGGDATFDDIATGQTLMVIGVPQPGPSDPFTAKRIIILP